MNVKRSGKNSASGIELRVVVDTNVFVSSVIGSKNAEEIVNKLGEEAFRLVISTFLLTELATVLERPKFQALIQDVGEARAKLLHLVEVSGTLVERTKPIEVCRDATDIGADAPDNRVLEAAVAGRADVIVTGDGDLLELDPFQGIEIMTPARFLEILDRRR